MANRNVSQLPENTDPQDTDWILGASGNSPSVLQKIALGNLPSSTPSNGGGSIKFSLPVNENKVLDSSGYYFTDTIASDITIDCSNLGIGDHIIWHNLSTKAVFFSGLNSIDGVQIPANQGVRIAANSSIQFFVLDNSKNIKNLSGNHTIGWLPGLTPLGFRFWRISYNGNLSEIQYKASDGTFKTFVPSNKATMSVVSGLNASTTPLSQLSDGILSTTNNQYVGSADGGGAAPFFVFKVTFTDPVSIDQLAIYPQGYGNGLAYNMPGVIKLEYSDDDNFYVLKKQLNIHINGAYEIFSSLANGGFTNNTLKVFDFS